MTKVTRLDGDERYYEVETSDGVRRKLISVTTVLNRVLAKPALVPWAFNLGVENCLDIIRQSASTCIDEGRADEFILATANISTETIKNKLKESEKTTKDESEKGANRGTRVHTHLENIISGIPEAKDLQTDDHSYVNTLEKFIDEYGVQFEESELTVYSLDKGYAGTLDAVAKITKHPPRRRHASLVGKRVLLDLKTNKNASVYPEFHLPQLTAYRNAAAEMGLEVDESVVVAVGPERYGICVNYYPDNAFDVVHEVFKMLEAGKKANPNGRSK